MTMQPRLTVLERRDQRVIDTLLIAAEDVQCTQSSRYRLAAAIIKKRKVLGLGVNHYKKTHPLQAEFKKHEKANYPCSEVKAIANAKRRFGAEALQGATIYIARLKYTDAEKTSTTTGLAFPCIGCQRHIKEFGIARIVYTTESGFECKEVDDV